MMHPEAYAVHTLGGLPISHAHDSFFDSLPTQMAVSQAARRPSRSSVGQRPASTLRVTKPSNNSNSNSPRSSKVLGRRRTMVGGSTPRRHQPTTDYLPPSHSNDAIPSRKPNARPVSWHPTTHLQYPHHIHHHIQHLQQLQSHQQSQEQLQLQPQPHNTVYPVSTPATYADQQDMYSGFPQFSPMMASYSNNTSPASSSSPLPLGYQGIETSQYLPSDGWDPKSTAFTDDNPSSSNSRSRLESFPVLPSPSNERDDGSNGADWNSFIMHGFSNTSPPTPESFIPTQQPQPVVSDARAPYQTLGETEEEGEILVGMGLYDTPEKFQEDPHLLNYRSTVSSLLGSSFRAPEPRGKGLKLEETWEPPKSDDEDDDDEGDDDAEGE